MYWQSCTMPMVFCETPVVSAALLMVVSPLYKYIRQTNLLYSFIFFHTTIQVNDTEASLSNMSNTINKKPCKTQPKLASITKFYSILFFYTKILIFITFFFFTKNTCSLLFYFPTYTMLKYDKNMSTILVHKNIRVLTIVQYSYIFLYEYCCRQVQMIPFFLPNHIFEI